ncbi:chaperone NapD [Sansalvadorimonas verongulae]|uniref:chaperone NapD n=1 Tax=Sansalvadorimonas verongulae TaxID=2172824 RepID=UPI0012BCCC6C|nr:chaperone NapD [Sansalvadorimonas verongulae]MTI14822.1 hypothetical protein [Sansalvadorimonas verongulae]
MSKCTQQPIDICGLVILSKPDLMPQVKQQLTSIPGLVIHACDESGRMAVTIEDTSITNKNHLPTPVVDNIDNIWSIRGVVDVSLAYSHCE